MPEVRDVLVGVYSRVQFSRLVLKGAVLVDADMPRIVVRENGDLDVYGIGWDQVAGPVRPFDGDDGAALQIVGKTDGEQVVGAGQPIEVHVDQAAAGTGVVADKGEGGAGYGPGDTECAGDALDKSRLAGTQVPCEGDDTAMRQQRGYPCGYVPGISQRMNGLVSHH